jgi:hypothetical protein
VSRAELSRPRRAAHEAVMSESEDILMSESEDI